MTNAALGVVAFLLGVMVGRDVSVVDMFTGRESAVASEEDPLAFNEQSVVASTTRREPSVAATDGADLSYFRRLDEDRGPDLDARLLERSEPAPVAESMSAGAFAGNGLPGGAGSDAVRPDGYAIQVSTLREGAAAERMAQGLIDKGYPAFVVAPTAGVPVQVFRVRVGTYSDREEAEQVLRRLEGEESFKPWITR